MTCVLLSGIQAGFCQTHDASKQIKRPITTSKSLGCRQNFLSGFLARLLERVFLLPSFFKDAEFTETISTDF